MKIKAGRIEKFEEFSPFTSLKEFNHHMEMWMLEHKDEFLKAKSLPESA